MRQTLLYARVSSHDQKEDLARQVALLETLARLRCPLLAINGAKDLQVPPADAQTVAQLAGGGGDWEVVPDLTHVLRRDPGPPSLAHYKRLCAEPVDAEVLARVRDWIVAQAGRH